MNPERLLLQRQRFRPVSGGIENTRHRVRDLVAAIRIGDETRVKLLVLENDSLHD
jgi:hypothetical protein